MDARIFEELELKVAELTARIDRLESADSDIHAASTDGRKAKDVSLREFINTKQPKTANDHGLVIAYFTEIVKQQGWFNVDDLKSGFREAKIPAPKNLSDVIGKNAKKGYVMLEAGRTGLKQTWVLTSSGEKIVENGFATSDD